MIFKNTWLWILVAGALLLACFFHYEHSRHAPPGPRRIIAQLNAAAVTNVLVRLENHKEIRAQRTNGVWGLLEPARYPAENPRVEGLLGYLQNLTPAIYISRRELLGRPNAEEDYGFGSPQAIITLKQPDYEAHLYVGARTPPGDQVFLQVVGDEGIYVVDAELLNLVPKSDEDWRAIRLIDLTGTSFDRITITNSGKGFELRRETTNRLWKIVTSDFPQRADLSKVEEFLAKIQALRVQQFIPNDPKADLDAFGLQTPEFQFAVADGTNTVSVLQFGKPQTNDANVVFARRVGLNAITTVNRAELNPWPTLPFFRDPHLLTPAEKPSTIEIHGRDNFSLVRGTNEIWRVLPQDFVADGGSVKDLLQVLSEMQIVQYVKDTVIEQGLAQYGLDKPSLEYVLGDGSPDSSNRVGLTAPVRLQFGTNEEDRVYVRRSDESSVYAVKKMDTQRLGTASWQFRDRRIWKYSIDDLASVTIQHRGKVRKILRNGDHRWSVAPGSQGVVDSLAVEETLLDLVDLSAKAWIGRAVQDMTYFGFTNDDQHISLEFKNGETRTIEISPVSYMDFGLASVTLDGEPWIFAIVPSLRRDVIAYLSIPPEAL